MDSSLIRTRYSICKNAAIDLLLQQIDFSIIIDARKLKLYDNIYISTFQNFSEVTGIAIDILTSQSALRDGYTLKTDGRFIILYDRDMENSFPQRMRFTLAHEIGHVYLGHDCDGVIEQQEANLFASELLAPSAIVERLVTGNYEYDIETTRSMFGLSWATAQIKIDNIIRKKKLFGSSCGIRERQLIQMYNDKAKNCKPKSFTEKFGGVMFNPHIFNKHYTEIEADIE